MPTHGARRIAGLTRRFVEVFRVGNEASNRSPRVPITEMKQPRPIIAPQKARSSVLNGLSASAKWNQTHGRAAMIVWVRAVDMPVPPWSPVWIGTPHSK